MKGKFSNPLAYVQVNDVVYELLGDISSSDSEGGLENYLTNINQSLCDSQEKQMARTKQTAKKSDPKTGLLPAVFPTPKGTPKRAASQSPARSSPRKRGRVNAGTGFTSSEESDFFSFNEASDSEKEVSFGNLAGNQPKPKPKNPKNPKPKGGKGGSAVPGDPQPGTSKGDGGKQPRQPLASKNMRKVLQMNNLVTRQRRGVNGFLKIARWNYTGRQKRANESERGYMKKAAKQHDRNGKLLRRNRPGTVALREIRFYQRSRCFLIPMITFQRLAREYGDDNKVGLRWQAQALYNLQVAAEAYMVGFLSDANYCAIHRKVTTIAPKDLQLAKRLRCHSNVGEGLAFSDQTHAYVL